MTTRTIANLLWTAWALAEFIVAWQDHSVWRSVMFGLSLLGAFLVLGLWLAQQVAK